uniref:Uncharacterized protein n=1 Tax=Craspedostauros australis TaxID=1486917 RepID=A0A7R9WV36_9STRA
MNAINNMNGIGSGTNNNNSNANNGSIGNSQEEANFMGGMKLSLGLSLGDDDQNLLNAFLEQRDSTMAKGLMGTSSFPSNNQRHLPVNLNTDSNKLSQLGGGGHFMQQNMFLPSSGLMNQNNQPSPLDLFSLQSGSIGTNNMLMSQQNMMKQMPSIIANSNLPMNSAINNGPSIFSSNAAAAAAASGNGNQFLGGGHDSSQATASLLLNSLENNPGAFKGLSAQQTNQLRNFGF